MPTVFIVRPFGNKRPVIKKNKDGIPEIDFFDFDKVETDLIIPAMIGTKMEGGTTQRIFKAGEIKEDMFSALLLADIVIADITIHNANVFYELGIRHALRYKTTILIKCPGYDETPFDIVGFKYIEYQKDDPGKALDTLIRFLTESPDSLKKDSPVFNLLPLLSEQDREKFLAVPEDFGEELTIATKVGMLGKLKLLMSEVKGFNWELQANRYLGESFFILKALQDGRIIWEKVKDKIKSERRDDIQANDRLSTIYQRLAEAEMAVNPVNAEALLVQSDLANTIILNNYKNIDGQKRAEVYALKGRNAKTRWINEWKNLPDDKKEQQALRSPNLEAAYKNYEAGFYENLNHYYSGINALGLLTIIITLAKKYPNQWLLIHDEDDENDNWGVANLDKKLTKLSVTLQFSLEAEKKRLRTLGVQDIWFNITEADYAFLTSTNPSKVGAKYSMVLVGAGNFAIESVEKQLSLYERLNILIDNVKAAQAVLPVKTSAWEGKTHYLVFSGHMIDKPGEAAPRFPASIESIVKTKIKEQIQEASKSLEENTVMVGIAGGACGGDILFHEVCHELEIKTQIFLAMPRDNFVVESVAFAGPGWIDRFNKLYDNPGVPKFELSDKTELPRWLKDKADYDIWKRNNLWQLNSAMIYGSSNMTLISLWDSRPGNGPGGTDHMVNEAKKRGLKILQIDISDINVIIANS